MFFNTTSDLTLRVIVHRILPVCVRHRLRRGIEHLSVSRPELDSTLPRQVLPYSLGSPT